MAQSAWLMAQGVGPWFPVSGRAWVGPGSLEPWAKNHQQSFDSSFLPTTTMKASTNEITFNSTTNLPFQNLNSWLLEKESVTTRVRNHAGKLQLVAFILFRKAWPSKIAYNTIRGTFDFCFQTMKTEIDPEHILELSLVVLDPVETFGNGQRTHYWKRMHKLK